jgi:hypothetical protein
VTTRVTRTGATSGAGTAYSTLPYHLGSPLVLAGFLTQKTTDLVTGTPLKLQNITQKTTDRVTGTPLKLQNITQKTTDLVTGTPLIPGVSQGDTAE